LPEHSAIEFRRYMNRFLYLFGHLSDMTGVMRTPINQHQAFIEPLVAWLRPRGVNFLTSAFVQDIDFAPSPGRVTVARLDYTRSGSVTSVAVAPEDLVLVTTGSQAADLSAGSMTRRRRRGRTDAPGRCGRASPRGARNSANPTHSLGRAGSPCRAG
jgi:oleate hydratase